MAILDVNLAWDPGTSRTSRTHTINCVIMPSVFFHPVRERCRWYARKAVIIMSLTTSDPHQMKIGAYEPWSQLKPRRCSGDGASRGHASRHIGLTLSAGERLSKSAVAHMAPPAEAMLASELTGTTVQLIHSHQSHDDGAEGEVAPTELPCSICEIDLQG
jgi:hypothetical protein